MLDAHVSEHVWVKGPLCCGIPPTFATIGGLAFIVRCQRCDRRTGLERCAGDAAHAWITSENSH